MISQNIPELDINSQLIEKPNYTQIPNVIIDYWMSRLPPSAFEILICVATDEQRGMSIDRIIETAGLSKSGANTSIKLLQRLGLIETSIPGKQIWRICLEALEVDDDCI